MDKNLDLEEQVRRGGKAIKDQIDPSQDQDVDEEDEEETDDR